jgi:hypothetical protein
MITSALISQCRREYGDEPKTVRVSRNGDGAVNTFNVGKFPVIEDSYTVKQSGSALVEGATSGFTFDLDNGDLVVTPTPGNGIPVQADFKFATWRDRNWNEAINQSIESLNSRGFFKQIVRDKTSIRLSAGIQAYSGPSGAVDVYEFLVSDNGTVSGNFVKPQVNMSYQQDANKIVIGNKPVTASAVAVSYLRNLKTYDATSATVDILDDWREIVKKKAGAIFYRSLAGKIAKQGNASIDEGHFSFTNLRTMANDLDNEFERLALRKKPTRPAKDIQWALSNGGVA